ncbi:MAG: peptidylprolyl isomerase [Ruminococcaceae bacterium]|nr:peptidylprolyl isomerase [Oscillospiraceae bacterium]
MSEEKILATVGSANITEADVEGFIAGLPREQRAYASNPQFKKHCLEQLISIHLYAMMGQELKLDETEEYKKIMESAKRDILSQLAMNEVLKNIKVTDEEIKEFYDNNPQHFTEGEKVSAKHILVKEESECLEILNAINNGETTFEDAAKEKSTCPSGQQGGDLGSFGRGQMVPEFENAAFAAEIGAIVGPVATQFGFHLIKVESKSEATVADFESVKAQIRSNLLSMKQNDAYIKKAEELKAKYMA